LEVFIRYKRSEESILEGKKDIRRIQTSDSFKWIKKGEENMKLNFTVDVDRSDDMDDLEFQLLNRSAELFLEQILSNRWDNNTDLYEKLEQRVISKLEIIMDVDFKNSVATKVTDNLIKKFERTKQYKELQSNGEVVTDSAIKSGLKDLVAEIVKSEMKKVFK